MRAVLAEEGRLDRDKMSVMKHRPHVMDVMHWHGHVEFNLLTAGRMWTELQGQEVEVRAGKVGLLLASYPHRVTRVEAAGDIFVLNVPMQRFRAWRLSIPARLAIMRGEMLVAEGKVPFQESLFDTWLTELPAANRDRQNLMFDEAHNLVRRLDQIGWAASHGKNQQLGRKTSRLDTQVERIVLFVEAEFRRQDLRIEDIASAVGLHPNYAMSVFKEVMGQSIGMYITHVRLAEAKQLLLTTDKKILAVAGESGFASSSRFYGAFQETLGTSPARYRAQAG